MAIQPKFLMIPTLYEESTATVSWENTPDGEHYDLDISFNEDFDTASHGKTWSDLELADWDWARQEDSSAHTWSELKTLPAQGLTWSNLEFLIQSWEQLETTSSSWQWIQEHHPLFTVFHGPGDDVATPDQGLTWGDLDSSSWSWTRQDTEEGSSWKQLMLIPSVGLLWWQHDQNCYSWIDLKTIYENWNEFDFQPTRGLCWGSLDARWLGWRDIETAGSAGDGTSWFQLEHLPPDNKTHKSTVVDIPLYTKSSMMRVRAIDTEERASSYLTSSMLEHRPRSLKKYTPPCLHIPQELREGRTAEAVWGDLYGASSYVLERKFDGDYAPCYDGEGAPTSHPSDCTKPKDLYYGPDCKKHLSHTDQLPYYQKQVQYRIKGYNTTDSSQYLESPVIPIIPVFYREDGATFSVSTNGKYLAQLHVKSVHDFEKLLMTLAYDPGMLAVETLILEQPKAKTDTTSGIFAPNITIAGQTNGSIRFRCIRAMTTNKEWSGLLVSVRLRALRSGMTTVALS